jgi:aerobic C4-dicarboxylate transport protein
LTHVHVVVPANDEEALLPRALGSLDDAVAELHRSRPDVRARVVLVLDACVDRSREVAARHRDVTVVEVDRRCRPVAALVGATGIGSLKSLGLLMLAFYATCAIFVFAFLGSILKVVTGMNVFSLFRYLGREFLLILSTSSSESALPRLIAKMEHLGVSRPVVGITVPTGYSFNLDGTAIYLTMASLFIAEAMDKPFSIGQQIGLLVFMIIASKGAAGVSGAGLATLAGGLQSHRPDLVPGVGFIVGIDRLMSEARALTNFAGNAIATVLIGTWVGEIDRDKAARVLSGQDRFDEASMLDHDEAVTDTVDGVQDGDVTGREPELVGAPR